MTSDYGFLPGLEQDNLIFAGIDEAGRGCLAGPVVAAAVILPEKYNLDGLTDSKKLDDKQRNRLAKEIKAQALAWAIGTSSAQIVDQLNILQGTFRAMGRAVTHLKVRPAKLLIDGDKTIPTAYLGQKGGFVQESVVKGDLKIPAISAASILAKTFRDDLLIRLSKRYPNYSFEVHKGYGTKVHYQALEKYGPCKIHRLSFKGVKPENKKTAGEKICLPGI